MQNKDDSSSYLMISKHVVIAKLLFSYRRSNVNASLVIKIFKLLIIAF